MNQRLREILHGMEFAFKASFWCSKIFFVFLLMRQKNASDEKFHFLLPCIGNGNIGDQAMVESFINNLGGKCVLIVEDKDKFYLEHKISPEPKVIEIPHLILGNTLQNMLALLTFLRVSNKMKSFSVIGGDIMDGFYSKKESINRLFLLRLVNSLGINSRITGFSWSANPYPLSTKLLKIISNETRLCLRDPKSAQRLKESKISSVYEVSDLVFSDDSVANAHTVDSWISSSTKPIVVINISGHFLNNQKEAYFEHVHQYRLISEYLKSKNFRIIILPHVFRVGDGDVETSLDLFKSACDMEDLLIADPLSPAQERQVLKHAFFVISGRMHVAILAFNMGKPVIALETMGKVSGLFTMFNLGQFCIDRKSNFSTEVIKCIDLIENDHASICKSIEEKLPEIRQRSSINFSGLI